MNIAIKSRPEDFKVEEIATLPLVQTGPFGVYRLDKSGWNTLDALREISKDLNIPSRLFSYGGKKDRHAQTTQYITVEQRKIKDYTNGSLRLTFVGFMDRPMGPDLIEANRFDITVRRLSHDQAVRVLDEQDQIKLLGYVNYFDDQRFGSFDADQGFLAEKLLLGHINGAVKILMTSIYSGDPSAEKKRRKFFFENWKDWAKCLTQAETEFERFAFVELQKGEKSALTVLKNVPKEELSMYFSAFQSFLWNRVVGTYVKGVTQNNGISVKGLVDDYFFYRSIPDTVFKSFAHLLIPTAAHNTKMPNEALANIYNDLLKSRSIEKPMFNKLKVRSAFFKTTDRPLVVVPREFSAEILDDEINKNEKKVVLKFVLPRGSYATMLVKRLMV